MFGFDTTTLFFSMLFGIIGLGYFSYGRKQNILFMISGIALMLFPYFVEQLGWLIFVGLLLSVLPFVLKRFV